MLRRLVTVAAVLALVSAGSLPALAQQVGVQSDLGDQAVVPASGYPNGCVECDRAYRAIYDPGYPGYPGGSGMSKTGAGFLQYAPSYGFPAATH